MGVKLVAVDIGSGRIKIVVGKASKNKVVVRKMLCIPTPAEAVDNGEILDMDALRETLSNAVRKNWLSGKRAVCTIQSSMFVSREFTIPRLEAKDVESALRFEVEQFMPIEVEDYVLSCRELETVENGVKYLVGLMPKRMVSSYHELLKAVNLKPMAMDVNPNAVEKLLHLGIRNTKLNQDTFLVADIGQDSMNMTVFEGGLPQMYRAVPLGGSEVTRSISTALGIEYDEAETRKVQRADMMAQEYEMLFEDVDLNSVAKSVASDWVEQLRRMAEFYMSRRQGKNIDRILLYGGSSGMKRLDEYMSSIFSVPVSVMEPQKSVKIRGRSSEPAAIFFNAIGAIIRK